MDVGAGDLMLILDSEGHVNRNLQMLRVKLIDVDMIAYVEDHVKKYLQMFHVMLRNAYRCLRIRLIDLYRCRGSA